MRLLHFLLHVFALGDVAMNPGESDDLAGAVAQRDLGGPQPAGVAGFRVQNFFFGVVTAAGPEHVLLIGKEFLGHVPREAVAVRPADGGFGILEAEHPGVGDIVDDDAALRVFDEDVVGEMVDQRAEEIALFGQFAGAVADPGLQYFIGLLKILLPPLMIADDSEKQSEERGEAGYRAQCLEPRGLINVRRQLDGELISRGVPDAVGIAGLDVEVVTAGFQIGEERGTPGARVGPSGIVSVEAVAELHSLIRHETDAGVLNLEFPCARLDGKGSGRVEFDSVDADPLDVDRGSDAVLDEVGRVDHDQPLRTRKPDPPVGRAAAGVFDFGRVDRFDRVLAVIRHAFDVADPSAEKIVQAPAADPEDAAAGIHPDPAAIVRHDGVDKVVEQPVVAAEALNAVTGQPADSRGQGHPDVVLIIFTGPKHVVIGQSVLDRPML